MSITFVPILVLGQDPEVREAVDLSVRISLPFEDRAGENVVDLRRISRVLDFRPRESLDEMERETMVTLDKIRDGRRMCPALEPCDHSVEWKVARIHS